MSEREIGNFNACPSSDVAAYIDGELSADAEMALDLHMVGCSVCSAELNCQKELVQALSYSLNDDLELPENFARRVITNAESSVGGLRRKSEWISAAFVIFALLFFVLFSMGADAGRTFGTFVDVFERAAAVGGFAAHVVYNLSIGGVVVLRSVGSQAGIGGIAVIMLFGLLAVPAVAFSRVLLRYCRI